MLLLWRANNLEMITFLLLSDLYPRVGLFKQREDSLSGWRTQKNMWHTSQNPLFNNLWWRHALIGRGTELLARSQQASPSLRKHHLAVKQALHHYRAGMRKQTQTACQPGRQRLSSCYNLLLTCYKTGAAWSKTQDQARQVYLNHSFTYRDVFSCFYQLFNMQTSEPSRPSRYFWSCTEDES